MLLVQLRSLNFVLACETSAQSVIVSGLSIIVLTVQMVFRDVTFTEISIDRVTSLVLTVPTILFKKPMVK